MSKAFLPLFKNHHYFLLINTMAGSLEVLEGRYPNRVDKVSVASALLALAGRASDEYYAIGGATLVNAAEGSALGYETPFPLEATSYRLERSVEFIFEPGPVAFIHIAGIGSIMPRTARVNLYDIDGHKIEISGRTLGVAVDDILRAKPVKFKY